MLLKYAKLPETTNSQTPQHLHKFKQPEWKIWIKKKECISGEGKDVR